MNLRKLSRGFLTGTKSMTRPMLLVAIILVVVLTGFGQEEWQSFSGYDSTKNTAQWINTSIMEGSYQTTRWRFIDLNEDVKKGKFTVSFSLIDVTSMPRYDDMEMIGYEYVVDCKQRRGWTHLSFRLDQNGKQVQIKRYSISDFGIIEIDTSKWKWHRIYMDACKEAKQKAKEYTKEVRRD